MQMVTLKPIRSGYAGLSAEEIAIIESHANAKRDSIYSEPSAEMEGLWYILLPQAGQQHTASAHLQARRFGIYTPLFDRSIIIRGKAHPRRDFLFPGYIFALIWDIEKMWKRVRSCPGVAGVMLEAGQPKVVPQSVINDIQIIEAKEMLSAIPQRRRHRRKYREEAAALRAGDQITISCKSYWREMMDDNPETRKSALRTALGLN